MIRELPLKCSECRKDFTAKNNLLYKEDFKNSDFAKIRLICPECFTVWQNYWQIDKAEFFEEQPSLYVNITLANGERFLKLDCSALDDVVVTEKDMPLAAQKNLYQIYRQWYDEKMKDVLKNCVFAETFMRTSFTCETHGGVKYEDIAFRFTRQGLLETEKEIPDDIRRQVIAAWHRYEPAVAPCIAIAE